MRDAFSSTLVSLGQADPKVLLLTGDHGYALFDEFRKHCPKQYINAGVAEQNMVGMAAGLARVGFRPFVYGLAAFIPIRVIEQIKLDIAHDNLPVVLLGDGAGFVYSHLGTSHQSTEDIACTRSISNLKILSPADRHEIVACLSLAYNKQKPTYLRIGKSDRGDVHQNPINIHEFGEVVKVRCGSCSRITIIATGSMVRMSVDVAEQSLDVSVWSAPCIKPINSSTILDIAHSSSEIVVIEEHSTLGGLGSAISEIVSETSLCRVLRIGIRDRFSNHCGSYEYLLEEHELDYLSVRDHIKNFYDSL